MCGCTPRDTPRHTPAVARLSVPLAAKDQGTKCTLSMVADSAGARPREAGTEEWPSLIDFCCFRHHLDVKCRMFPSNGRKLRKSIKGGKAKVVGCHLPPTLSDSAGNNSKRALSCFYIAKQTSQHTPSPNLCVSKSTCRATGHYTCGCQLHTDITRSKSFSDSQNRETPAPPLVENHSRDQKVRAVKPAKPSNLPDFGGK